MTKLTHRNFVISITTTVLTCILLAVASTMAAAQAGQLDTTFAGWMCSKCLEKIHDLNAEQHLLLEVSP